MFDPEFIARFWKNVARSEDGCWAWLGKKDTCGYGVIKFHQKSIKAHRAMFEITNGKIEIGKCILHACDNPGCVNPKHLQQGTQKQNAMDRSQRGRSGNVRGERNGRAKLTPEQVEKIREIWEEGQHTKVSLAKLFGVSDVQIKNIVQNYQWKKE